ncbi:hypothetical protein MCO_01629 [Bartonella sp. DB5-6]|uniref:hypothetical protein n=1 Tax=Bartonella TaxID=773 RepID=UPI00026E9624|nr:MULTISPECIES: hypothetical protein [Bartonella]EJF76272.1 hypothetical protein MCO_01629 [Bartonella sp. DB5-6]
MVGKMVKKRSSKDKDLTETEQQLLHEMIETYQGLKMMSRIMKWLAFIVFMFIIDFARIMDALDNIFSHLKKWIIKS